MTRAEAWTACRDALVGANFAAIAYQRADGEGRVVIGCRTAGQYLEMAFPAGYDEFELVGRISARLAGTQWDGAAYSAAVERHNKARERAKGQ